MTQSASETNGQIIIKGARTHNLKGIDLTLSKNQLVVITGVSGSGKSSLAFDTLYAEGQRRYVESLSAYARQFLERMEKPDVDRIDGISPAIAIRQKNSIRNPRSTVGTTTEINDYLRLLFARAGQTICRQCGRPVTRETAEVVAKKLTQLTDGTHLFVGFVMPLVTGAAEVDKEVLPALVEEETTEDGVSQVGGSGNGTLESLQAVDLIQATIETLRRKGFGRLYVDGRAVAFKDVNVAAQVSGSLLEVVVDRIKVAPEMLTRLTDSIEIAYHEGGGTAFVIEVDQAGSGTTRHEFSEHFECRTCDLGYEAPQPRLFSFNNPFGACPTCHGFGNIIELDMNLVVPDPSRSVQQDAIEPWSKPHYRKKLADLKRAVRVQKIRLDVPWEEMSDQDRQFIIEGDGEGYDGIRGFFRRLERKKYKVHIRVFLSLYRGYLKCPDCAGTRLRPEARDVQVDGRTIDQICALTVSEGAVFFSNLALDDRENAIVERVLNEIRKRLTFLGDDGLDYLTLDRLSSTLSGGEAQRINLATSLGSALVGTLYVLDEPSIGLHPRDNQRLIAILQRLRDQGTTVVVVEHDADMIRVADHVVDLGLGAGDHGGSVVFTGPYEELLTQKRS